MSNFLQFEQAIVDGNLLEVQSLFDKNYLNQPNASGVYPVHLACQHNREDILKFFIDNDCDIELCDNNASRPIHIACEKGHSEIIKLLINRNCEMCCTRQDGKIPYDITKDNYCRDLVDDGVTRMVANSMELTCGPDCNHEFCYTALIQKTFKKDVLIGIGSKSEFYKLHDIKTKGEFVVKVIQRLDEDGVSIAAKYVERNINKFVKTLKHPNIAKYFGAIHIVRKLNIFMEYVPGGSMQDHIRKYGAFPHGYIVKCSRQILDGLAFLHSHNIIHRDVKPANIIIRVNGDIKLIHFGDSWFLEKSNKENKDKYERASTVGSRPNYIAPEVIIGGSYDFKSDVWAVGATVVEMLSGKMPFDNLTANNVIMRLGLRKKIEFIPVKPMSRKMKRFVKRLLEPNPVNRQAADTLLALFENDSFL